MLNNSVLASLGVSYFQFIGSIIEPFRISPLKPIVAVCNVALSMTPGFKVKNAVDILVWES